ncbi:MAG: hypothetical protein K2Y27_23260 [Xanthobacteraceae bacterium]|nr:hypothetical protein [Xanthobacteraceae bacterium]
MNVPLLVARPPGKLAPKLAPETSSQDLPANKVPPSIFVQSDEPPQKRPVGDASKPIGNSGNLNEPVVPVEELRLLARTRQPRKPWSGDRVRICVFFGALIIIAAGAAGHRYLDADASRAAADIQDVVPEQPPSQPAPPLAKVEEANAATEDSSKAAAQEAPSIGVSPSSTETVSTEQLNQRLDAAVHELATLRALVQQLADKQEETTRKLAEVQAKEKAVRQPPLPPPPRAATPRKPASSATPSATPPEPARAAAQVQQPSASTNSPDSHAPIPRPPMPLRSD